MAVIYYGIDNGEIRIDDKEFNKDARKIFMGDNQAKEILADNSLLLNTYPFSSVINTLKEKTKTKVDRVLEDDPGIDGMEGRID